MILCRCPSCGQTLEAPAEQGGAKVSCPQCGQRMLIPPPRDRTLLAPRVEDGAAVPTTLSVPVPPSLAPYRPPPTVSEAPVRPSSPEPPAEQLEEIPEANEIVDDDRDRSRRRPRRWDEDDGQGRFRRRWRTDFEPCPRCGCTDYPRQTTRFGTASIVLIIIGIFFWPLIIVAFLVQEKWDVCADCGERLRQTGTGF
jgi:predicted RNA-binding Zn-ribbon protein involved in translation (DUF1610 family)